MIPIRCDMSNLNKINKIKKILSKEKKIDILINNVGGVIKRSSFLNSDDKLWQKVINLNLMSAVKTTRIVTKLLMKSKNGVILNISSVSSRTGGDGDSLHYATAKAAINIFTKGLAKELKKIRVVGIAPSAVDTDFQRKHSSKNRLRKIISETPIYKYLIGMAFVFNTFRHPRISSDRKKRGNKSIHLLLILSA